MANENNIKARVQLKHDVEANWNLATNFRPKAGELIIYDPDDNYTYCRYKIGQWTDGNKIQTKLLSALPFEKMRDDEALLYIEQNLTNTQKAQARANIDAVSQSELTAAANNASQAVLDLSNQLYNPDYETETGMSIRYIAGQVVDNEAVSLNKGTRKNDLDFTYTDGSWNISPIGNYYGSVDTAITVAGYEITDWIIKGVELADGGCKQTLISGDIELSRNTNEDMSWTEWNTKTTVLVGGNPVQTFDADSKVSKITSTTQYLRVYANYAGTEQRPIVATTPGLAVDESDRIASYGPVGRSASTTMSAHLMTGNPEYNYDAANKKYVDAQVQAAKDASVAKKSNVQTVYGTGEDGSQRMIGWSFNAIEGRIPVYGTNGTLKVGTPTADTHATTKKYVDDSIASSLEGCATDDDLLGLSNELANNYYNKEDIDTKYQEALEVANGKTKTFTIADMSALGELLSIDTSTVSNEYTITTAEITYNDVVYTLKQGDIFLIIDTDVPDYWVSINDMKIYKMETSKVDLDPYATIEYVDDKFDDTIGRPSTGVQAEIFNDYTNNIASGEYAHAEGYETLAEGYYSHTEGQGTVALGSNSHAEGDHTTAYGYASHTEGSGIAIPSDEIINSSNEDLIATWKGGDKFSLAKGTASHVEGRGNLALGDYSHAEGDATMVSGYCAHTEGQTTTASGLATHAEGSDTIASGLVAHAEGSDTIASGDYAHAEGVSNKASGMASHAEGGGTHAIGMTSHTEGANTTASGDYSHSEGNSNYSPEAIEGLDLTDNESIKTNWENTTFSLAKGKASHIEGEDNLALGDYAHAEGCQTIAEGYCSHSEGYETVAEGDYSHTEGYNTTASGSYSHAEGNGTTASNTNTHAEGAGTKASGNAAHAEGMSTQAIATCAHAEGKNSVASSEAAHAEGYGTQVASTGTYGAHSEGYGTIAAGPSQHVQGKYNISDTTSAHIIGNGTSANARSNAHTVDWSGNAWYAGKVAATNQVRVLGDSWTSLNFRDANDTATRAAVMITDTNCIHFNNMETGATYADRYKLPDVTTGKTADSWYAILTSKNAVTIAQGGTGATTAANAIKNLGIPSVISNPNLLINGDFKINQRGQSSYTGAKYTFDRWCLSNSYSTITENTNGGVTFSASGGNAYLIQRIENGFNSLKGKTVTYSIKINNVIYSKTGTIPTSKPSSGTSSIGEISITGGTAISTYLNSSGILFVQIGVKNGNSFSIEYVKLEIGSYATPFSPRPYAEELAMCQRYYQIVHMPYRFLSLQESNNSSYIYVQVPVNPNVATSSTPVITNNNCHGSSGTGSSGDLNFSYTSTHYRAGDPSIIIKLSGGAQLMSSPILLYGFGSIAIETEIK